MLEAVLYALIIGMPIVYLSGIAVGGYLTRWLAYNGGEERFPEFVQNAVKAYRDRRHIDEFHRD